MGMLAASEMLVFVFQKFSPVYKSKCSWNSRSSDWVITFSPEHLKDDMTGIEAAIHLVSRRCVTYTNKGSSEVNQTIGPFRGPYKTPKIYIKRFDLPFRVAQSRLCWEIISRELKLTKTFR